MKPPRILLRIVSACLLPALLIGLGCLGCQEGGGGDETADPAAYARDVKTQLTEKLNSAKRDSANAAFNVSLLVRFLEDYQTQPVGDHRQTYADLLAQCQDLQQMYEQSASAAQTGAKIDEIMALAGKLPGEVVVDQDEEE